jgi:hypothetical protein
MQFILEARNSQPTPTAEMKKKCMSRLSASYEFAQRESMIILYALKILKVNSLSACTVSVGVVYNTFLL